MRGIKRARFSDNVDLILGIRIVNVKEPGPRRRAVHQEQKVREEWNMNKGKGEMAGKGEDSRSVLRTGISPRLSLSSTSLCRERVVHMGIFVALRNQSRMSGAPLRYF